MQTPDPLPQPGAWLVTADGSMYEIVEPGCAVCHEPADPYHGPDAPAAHIYQDSTPTVAATAEGAYYLSVDSGEVIWTPWADVYAVGSYDEVEAIAASIVRAEALAEWSMPAPIHETGPRVAGQLGPYALRDAAASPETVAAALEAAHRAGGHYALGHPATGCPLCPESETVARYVVTIRHRQGGDPYTPDMLRAVAAVMAAALAAAGIPATATAERFPEDATCRCGEDREAHEWHYEGTHTYDPSPVDPEA